MVNKMASKNLELRVCFCVPDYLGDLWVCGRKPSVEEALCNSQMRAGPIGLIDCFDLDYYILKDAYRDSRKFLDSQEQLSIGTRFQEIRKNGIRGMQSVDVIKALCRHSIRVREIDFSMYDIVICINDIIPRTLRKQFRSTCFVCMPADGIIPRRTFGYDGIITQYSSLKWERDRFLVDIPYTFASPDTIERSLIKMGKKNEMGSYAKKIYLEINSFNARPIRLEEHRGLRSQLEKNGYSLCAHHEYIVDNLAEISSSLFYLKIYGRPVRGNGIIESISAGCPILARKDRLLDVLPLPANTYISGEEELLEILKDPSVDNFRAALLKQQREAVELYIKKAGITQMESIVRMKRMKCKQSRQERFLEGLRQVIRLICLRACLPLLEGEVNWR